MPKQRRNMTVACAVDSDISSQLAKAQPIWDRARGDLDVVVSLRHLYRAVHLVPVGESPEGVLDAFHRIKPDVIFNLALSALEKETSFAGCLEFLDIPYTGSGPMGISLAGDKVRSRELLRAAGLRVPRFAELPVGAVNATLDLTPPVIVKPAQLGGCSHGIYRDSVVQTREAALARAKRVWRRLGVSAVCDEFVVGRELRIAAIEEPSHSRFRIVGVSECRFPGITPGHGFKNEGVRVNSRVRKARRVTSVIPKLPRSVLAELAAIADSASRVLNVRGYATLDVRMDDFERVTVLEVNANPGLARRSLSWRRPSFTKNIQRIVDAALAR